MIYQNKLIQLHNNWIWTNLKDIAYFKNGINFKKTQKGAKGIPTVDVLNMYSNDIQINLDNLYKVDIDVTPERLLKYGDILFVRSSVKREGVGWASLFKKANFPVTYCGFIIRARLIIPDILPEYLTYFFRTNTSRETIISGSSQVTITNINQDFLGTLNIPLPPLNEQKRIVAKIEAIQTRSTAVKEELEAIKPLLNQFRQSVLAAAFRGDLTKDWREQNRDVESAEDLLERITEELPQTTRKKDNQSLPNPFEINKKWQWVELSDVCSSITDGDHQAPPKSSCGIPFLVISNISQGKLNFDDTRYVPENYYNKLQENKKPRHGDIVYSVVGSYGIPVLVDTDKEFCFQRHIALLKPSNWLNNRYLLYALKSNFIYRQATRVATGTTQLTVTLTGLRKIKIPFTSLEEQKEIVRRIESLFKLADAIENQQSKIQNQIETLNQSILAKAFRGELVPQDPNDEPASVLLERIKADREKAKPKKSKKKKSSKKRDKQLDIPGI